MKSLTKHAAIALAAGAMVTAAPASATIFEYTFTNGDVMTIEVEGLCALTNPVVADSSA